MPPRRKPRKRSRKSAGPRALRVAKALDAMLKAVSESQVEISLNDQKVLQRIQNKLSGVSTQPLSEADITNIKRIASRYGFVIKF